MPTPDNPDEFYLLLAMVVTLFPLQWYLGRKLHKQAAKTSFFHRLFAISNADFHSIHDEESAEFRAALKAYKRTCFWMIFPTLVVIFGLYLWVKWQG
jgi:hypothetical protein